MEQEVCKMKILNPILKGFNPDPSMLRVGEDYYIATSTFEWFPGVQIHHSKDLINWHLITRPLNRTSQLDMRGNPNSGGIWAPCLSYCNGTYYLIYTDVKSWSDSSFKDTHNYLVTTNDICGEWSEPIYLNSSGFDPSLFHDDDGKKWFVNMLWDHRQGKNQFGGILLQEYSNTEKKLVGPVKNIFTGTNIKLTEGPHLYKRNGYYYLLTAEGGTSYEHAVTFARSKNIMGPYEVHPSNPILTSRYNANLPLQKAGHASLVETQDGLWYLAHLTGRPIGRKGRCVLGRETAIQKMEWGEDEWIRLASGGNEPESLVEAPNFNLHPWEAPLSKDDFNVEELNINYQSLRRPQDESFLSLKERPGYLRLKGRESLASKFDQCLIARRQTAFSYVASTVIEFEPDNFQQMAGLICFYDTDNYYYLNISKDESVGKCLSIITSDKGKNYEPLDNVISMGEASRIYLKAEVNYDLLGFFYSIDGVNWTLVGHQLDYSILSDENSVNGIAFTGAFIGLCCQDLSGMRKHADFDFFEYVEIE